MANSDFSKLLPRIWISGVHTLLESFEPIHGVLRCEELEIIRKLHPSDTSIDKEKDSIEQKLCVERNIPYLGICRGSQILNVSCGGTLYPDVEKELLGKCPEFQSDSLEDEKMEIMVNSYHHQGVKILAQRFVPIAFAPDDLEFVKAVIEYEKRVGSSTFVPRPTKLGAELALKRKVILESFSLARNIYKSDSQMVANQSSELEAGADFQQENVALSSQQENRLKQVGATIRNGSIYIHKLKMNQMREKVARTMRANMSIEQKNVMPDIPYGEMLILFSFLGLYPSLLDEGVIHTCCGIRK
ncbi:hypothetical protein RJT34_25498 [Clitoria ternatea]|uniref:Uncharacterized protein n=1 Tax=Clitoria ternatea TaxID=43366 RepID=A0AAN9IIW3_CLITE